MATFLKTQINKDIGTTPVELLATGSNNRYTIIGFNVANTTDYDIVVDISMTNSLAVTGLYINQLTISPYTSAKVVTNGEKIVIADNCSVSIVSDTDNSADVIISYAEIV